MRCKSCDKEMTIFEEKRTQKDGRDEDLCNVCRKIAMSGLDRNIAEDFLSDITRFLPKVPEDYEYYLAEDDDDETTDK